MGLMHIAKIMNRTLSVLIAAFACALMATIAVPSPVPIASAAPGARAVAPDPARPLPRAVPPPGTPTLPVQGIPAVTLNRPSVGGTRYFVPVGTSPVWGPADALVTVVIFGDLQCRFTQAALATLLALQAANKADLRLVWKHLPLAAHSRAVPAAHAAVEAHQRGRFWPFVEAIRKSRFALDDQSLEKSGVAAGLKAGQVTSALKARSHSATVQADEQLAGRLLVTATPSVFFNGERVQGGALPLSAFQAQLARARKEAQARLKVSGVARKDLYARIISTGIQPGPRAPIKPVPVPAAKSPMAGLLAAPRPGNAGAKDARSPARPTLHLARLPSHGSDDALVTAILFTNFRCGNTHEVWNAYQEIVREQPGMFRLVFVHHAIGKGDAVAWQASEAALAAQAQGKFWEMAEILFQNRYHLTPERIEEYAIELGLNEKAFRAALKGRAYRPRVVEDVQAATRFLDGSTACPVLWLNGRVQSGYLSTWRVRSFLNEAAKEVQGLRLRPLP